MVLVIIFSILLLLGWAVKHYYFSAAPTPEPARARPEEVLVLPVNREQGQSKPEPAASDTSLPKPKAETIESQHIPVKKFDITDNNPPNLSNHTYTIQKEEKKSFELMPGVNLRKGVVHVEIDEENKKWIEIKRNPSDSNNDYQIMLKKKF
ncbi:hypothetical protein [Sporomusa sp.]|uniref:hypothetical protein n=1 Tax=Sporomusa sp. TaxID=2078658 RepID=UPI002BF46A09|nr:hypothetical protein [Sporomusa sp.]HWR07857.1 hypothetical protein [Sporomusa sp.]